MSQILESNQPQRKVHNPTHPQADAGLRHAVQRQPGRGDGQHDLASRSYQNNVEVMNTAKTLLLKTLQMGQ